MKIQGAVALVTGASGGIGKEFIQGLQTAGVTKIYICARKIDKLAEIAQGDPERIIPIKLDIAQESDVEELAHKCQDVTLLINGAGISRDTSALGATSLENARAEMETNYFGTMAMCRAFAPILKANNGGAIVNVISLLGRVNLPFMGTYCASKAAVLSLTQCVRAELAAQGTLVIAVMPGTVDTPFARYYPDPKVAPGEVVRVSLEAIEKEEEDVYPGEQAAYLSNALLQDPKAVEKQLAGMLPEMYEQLKKQVQEAQA